MQHLSSDALTALALGDSREGAAHLETCAACRGEVRSLRAAAERIRAGHVRNIAPPAGLWDRIATDIAADATPDRAPDRAPVEPSARDASAVPQHRGAAGRRAGAVRRRRRFSVTALAAACAASAAIAATVAAVVVTQLEGDPGAQRVASAVLEPLAPDTDPASAEVVERDGERVLIVEADDLPAVDGYLDVWVLDGDAQQMVSLGIMDQESIELALPADLDLGRFPIVDVSIEPYDGDPTHSGNSIWRGALGS